MTKKIYNRAVLDLTAAGIIWGASFTLVRWALESFSATSLMFWRFLIAFAVGETFVYLFNREGFKNSHSDIKRAMIPGIFLGCSLFFQTYGLNFTTATNSGFITSLYVVMIPFILFILFKHPIHLRHILFSLMAFVGMAFLLGLKDLQIGKGEWLTLAAAFTAAIQIIWVGRTAPESVSAFRYNNYQIFWSFITLMPFLLFETQTQGAKFWPEVITTRSVLSIVVLALVVSLLAFYLQVRAQRTLTTTTSSMLCLLEGPFAFIFGAIFLMERLNWAQAAGAALILGSCALSVIYDRPNHGHS